jgi:glycosyltransferase involved in cell wall biosynthesis
MSDSDEAIAQLEEFCQEVIIVPMGRSRWRDAAAMASSLARGEPFLIARDWVAEMADQIERIFREASFDVIHADQLWMARYALEAKAQDGNVRLVLDQHNAVHLIPQRLAQAAKNPLSQALLSREASLMGDYEVRVCQEFDQVVWVTREDRRSYRQLLTEVRQGDLAAKHPDQSVFQDRIIPICIDPDSVTPRNRPKTEPDVLFVGGMHWPPNAEGVGWYLEEVWPLVRARIPEGRCSLVGKAPPKIAQETPGVVAPGYVEDLNTYWERSRVFIVPLRAGGGMRVKILDAWVRGIPVVSTSIGAEGIRYKAGGDILIADTPQRFAEAVIQVMSDAELAERLAVRGRRSVEAHYDWEQVYAGWDEVYAPLGPRKMVGP